MPPREGADDGGAGGEAGGFRRPKRSLGQNFLFDPNTQRRIVAAARLEPDDRVLEIGPGRGALTRHMAGRVARLILVEIDDSLVEGLRREFKDEPGVEIVHRDILDLSLREADPDPASLKVVGNIPYNITAPLLFHLLEAPAPREILVMVQREVAERIVAEPGGREYGALAVGIRSLARVEQVLSVPPTVFRPRPRVHSEVIRIVPIRPRPLPPTEEILLRDTTRALFQWRRKQLRRILRDHPELALGEEGARVVLERAGVDPSARPETLSPERVLALARLAGARRRPGGTSR